MVQIKSIFCLLTCCALLGCSSISTHTNPITFEPVACVTPDLRAHKPLLLIQNIHAKYLDTLDQSVQREVTFEAYLASNSSELKLSILFMGFRAWDINYNGETIFEKRTSQVPQELQANYLLRDITLSYWPGKNIMRQNPKLLVIDKDNERIVKDNTSGETLINIRYLNHDSSATVGRLVLTNYKENYQLIIDSREP